MRTTVSYTHLDVYKRQSQDIVSTLVAAAQDLGGVPKVDGDLTDMLGNPLELITLLEGALAGSRPIGVQAAIEMCIRDSSTSPRVTVTGRSFREAAAIDRGRAVSSGYG